MKLPGLLHIFIRLRPQRLRSAGKLLFLNCSVAETFDLADAVKFLRTYKGKGTALFACPSGSSNSMHIIFYVLRKIIIDHRFHIVHINTSRRHICCNEDIGASITETVHCHVSLVLGQIAMQSLRPKSRLPDHLRQLVHLQLRIAENQTEPGLEVLQQPDARRVLVLLPDPVVSLRYQWNRKLLGCHLHHLGVLLESIGNI